MVLPNAPQPEQLYANATRPITADRVTSDSGGLVVVISDIAMLDPTESKNDCQVTVGGTTSLLPQAGQQSSVFRDRSGERHFPFGSRAQITSKIIPSKSVVINKKNFSPEAFRPELGYLPTTSLALDTFLPNVLRKRGLMGLQTLRKILGILASSNTRSEAEKQPVHQMLENFKDDTLAPRNIRVALTLMVNSMWMIAMLIITLSARKSNSTSPPSFSPPPSAPIDDAPPAISEVASDPAIYDVTFVAIDFGYHSNCHVKEIGISTSDTRNVLYPGLEPEEVITTSNLHVEPLKFEFNHGKAEFTCMEWLIHYLRQLFCLNERLDEDQRHRRIVLVGHGIDNEFRILEKPGIDLRNSPAIVLVIDTAILVSIVMGSGVPCQLAQVAKQYGMKDIGFHNSGNDANVTLRVMLLPALNDLNGVQMTDTQQKRLRFYTAMAGDHQSWTPLDRKAAKKAAKEQDRESRRMRIQKAVHGAQDVEASQ